jgi:hypothetical protein
MHQSTITVPNKTKRNYMNFIFARKLERGKVIFLPDGTLLQSSEIFL